LIATTNAPWPPPFELTTEELEEMRELLLELGNELERGAEVDTAIEEWLERELLITELPIELEDWELR